MNGTPRPAEYDASSSRSGVTSCGCFSPVSSMKALRSDAVSAPWSCTIRSAGSPAGWRRWPDKCGAPARR